MWKIPDFHACSGRFPNGGHDDAITGCVELQNGELWAGDGLRGSQVAFCPYCGYKAKQQPKVEPINK